MHDSSITGNPRLPRLYHGWLVVAAAFLVALYGFGVGFYGPGIYLVALKELHGWPVDELSSAITTYYVLGATLLFFWVGPLFDRHGARKVVLAGTVAMACGTMLLAHVTRPWQVYAAFTVMSAGWAAMSGAAINIIVAPWFHKRRGLAVSWALNGASAGGVIIAPLLTFLTTRFGFAVAIEAVTASMHIKRKSLSGFTDRPRLYLRSSVAAVRSSSDPYIAGSGATRKNVPLTGLPVFPLKRWSRRRMWLPRRVKNTGQRCAHCDPVPIRRPATGLNGERACGASLEPRGGEPKKSPRQNHATAWGRKPRAPEYASNDAKSSQIDFCVLDWPKRHRPPSIISEGRKGDSFVLRRIARNSLQNESRLTEQMGNPFAVSNDGMRDEVIARYR